MTTNNAATRRQVLATIGLAAPVLAIAESTSSTAPKPLAQAAGDASAPHATPTNTQLEATRDVARYLGEVKSGAMVGPYQVVSVGQVERGGVPVVLRAPSGARFRVDILRFDPSEGRRGIGEAGLATVFLCNGGEGNTATDEESGLGAMALAGALKARELAGATLPAGLLTMGERMSTEHSLLG